MSDQKGIPIWDKMKVFDTPDATGLLIPLSEDSKTLSSILSVRIDDKNNVEGVTNITNDMLKSVIYDDKIDKKFREHILYTFMYVDNQTFDNEFFTNIPTDLFVGLKYGENRQRIRMKNFGTSTTATNSPSSKILVFENCSTGWNCKNHENWSSCDHCAACYSPSCNIIIVYIPAEQFPSGGGGGGSSDGGGGGTPGHQPPKDPCTTQDDGGVFYRLNPICGGETDSEDNLPSQTNCETLQQASGEQKVKNAIDNLKTKTTGRQEFAYEIERKYNNAIGGHEFTTNPRVGTEFGTKVATGEHVKGQAHNHPSTGMSIPSIGDIIWLKLCKENIAPASANAYNIVVCYDPANPSDPNSAIVYSITIDDFTALQTKVNEIWNRADLQGKDVEDKYKILNDEMSKSFADVQNNSNGMEKKFLETYSSFGISLNKQDNVTKNWDKLSVNNNVVTKTPCQ